MQISRRRKITSPGRGKHVLPAGILAGLLAITAFAALVVLAPQPVRADNGLWEEIRKGNAVVLMRHALAPGTGDPADFDVNDCSTQRNLSEEGRQQAMRTGDRFRENGITSARVLTSQWCRCKDTAELLDLGTVEEFEPLNSFFQRREREAQQTEATREFIATIDAEGEALIMVTHQVNITGLTGVFPRSGEMIVVSRDTSEGISVLGRLDP